MDLTSFLVLQGNTSKSFRQTVERTLSVAHPSAVRLAEHGRLKVLAGSSMTQIYPDHAKVTPRGWPAGTGWANADGCFDSHRRVVVTEGLVNWQGQFVESQRVPGVLLHELGHGLDLALEYFSRSPEFVEAYLADVARLIGRPVEQKLGYFLQGFDLVRGKLTCAGLSETMAETFAALSGRTPNRQNRPLMLRAFPRTVAAVRHRLDTY